MRDMEQLHKLRIKLKRFRYALQSVPEMAASPQLLRSLKYLQDMLGLLHDDYVNEQYLAQLVAAHDELPELRYEVAMLRGWERAKADAAPPEVLATYAASVLSHPAKAIRGWRRVAVRCTGHTLTQAPQSVHCVGSI